jgi:hypothetical protein
MALFWIKHIRTIALLVVFAAVSTACGGGSSGNASSSDGGVVGGGGIGGFFDPSDETLGGSMGALGVTTISAQTENYDVVVSIGEAAPVGLIESEAGHYEIDGSMSF